MGLTEFVRRLLNHKIKFITRWAYHPQTNGKVERFFRTVEEKIHEFKSVDELVTWHNSKSPQVSEP